MELFPLFSIAHTQDNSFLGFVMGSQGKLSKAPMPTKKDQALLYAKQAGYVNSNVRTCTLIQW